MHTVVVACPLSTSPELRGEWIFMQARLHVPRTNAIPRLHHNTRAPETGHWRRMVESFGVSEMLFSTGTTAGGSGLRINSFISSVIVHSPRACLPPGPPRPLSPCRGPTQTCMSAHQRQHARPRACETPESSSECPRHSTAEWLLVITVQTTVEARAGA